VSSTADQAAEIVRDAGVAEPEPGADEEKRPTQAAQLVAIARERYHLVVSTDGRLYGVPIDGPNVVQSLRGEGGLRARLAKLYNEETKGSVPSQGALASAVTVLMGIAQSGDPVPVGLRVARHGESIVIDLGTADGRCVVVRPREWRIEAKSPVLFRRSGLTSPMATPVKSPAGHGFDLLRGLLNVDEDGFRTLVAWLVAACFPDIPHPVLAFKGEQGTGKSTAARMAVNLVDPSPAPLRSAPRDIKQWGVTASASWTVCLDNISSIQPWLSDTLCKAVTGDGVVERALFTDDDVTVMSFRRVIAMTSIDAGALAGDLAERLLLLELHPVPPELRKTDAEVNERYENAQPAILGALLDLLGHVLAELPTVHVERLPRMADFARILAAIDRITEWNTFDVYMSASVNIAADALDGDPFGQAVRDLAYRAGSWTGTALDMLQCVPPPDPRPRNWPVDATRAGGRIKRLAPLLRSVGITVDDTRKQPTGNRSRLYTLTCETPRK